MNNIIKPGSGFLLPYKFKYLGWLLLAAGLICSVLFLFIGLKYSLLDVNVFAVWSRYFDTRYFSIIENNISEELTITILLSGLFLVAFSKMKNENDEISSIRIKALFLSVYINTGLLLFSALFIYGLAFVYMAFFNIFSGLFLFILIFYIDYCKYLIKIHRTTL